MDTKNYRRAVKIIKRLKFHSTPAPLIDNIMNKIIIELETEHLLFCRFEENDAQAVFACCSNPNVSRFTSWDTHQSIEDSKNYIKWAKTRYSIEEGKIDICWALHLKDNHNLIGAIDFTQISTDAGRIDYMLTEAQWKQGIMTEAAIAVINWVFQQFPNFTKIESCGLTQNTGSIKVMQKSGMILEKKEMKILKKFRNKELEVSNYSITKEQWEKSNNL